MIDWFYVEATHWNGQVTYMSGELETVLNFVEREASSYQSVKIYQSDLYDQMKENEGWEL